MGNRNFLSETKLQVIDNIVFSQKVMYLFIHKFFKYFSTLDKREIGRYLQQSNLGSFLKIDTTLAVLSIDGKESEEKDFYFGLAIF